MEAGSPIRIVIADDHDLFSQALCALLRDRWKGAVVRRAASYLDLINLLETERAFDLVITDVRMPEPITANEIAHIVEASGRAKLILLSGDAHQVDIEQAIADGASRFVEKGQSGAALLSAIDAVIQPICSDTLRLSTQSEGKERAPLFSRRESQTLTLLIDGRSNKQIASELEISPATVKVYIKSLMRKAAVSTRTELAVFGLNHGLGRNQKNER